MSMILDALTRAEHERQLEKQPDLKFVTPVKSPKNKPGKIWLYVGLGVLANALILFFVIGAFSGNAENEMQIAASSETPDRNLDQTSVTASSIPGSQQQPMVKSALQQQAQAQASIPQVITKTAIQAQIQSPDEALAKDRPLAMEANSLEMPEVDRPLFYESRQPNAKPAASKPKQASISTRASASATGGKVSFSSTELSVDDAMPIINKPKLLIDQAGEAGNNTVNAQTGSGFVPKVRDLPESLRTSLNRYEVNVHVVDDNPARSFVLINMDKYKEGDRIADNGPLVEKITSEGVVVDYGSGRALLPAK